MITVRFFGQPEIRGFEVSGHSDFSEEGSDIVCAAVSSAAFMTANTVTDILGVSPRLEVSDGYMLLNITTDEEIRRSQEILRGFALHINALYEQYQKYIKVINTEV